MNKKKKKNLHCVPSVCRKKQHLELVVCLEVHSGSKWLKPTENKFLQSDSSKFK